MHNDSQKYIKLKKRAFFLGANLQIQPFCNHFNGRMHHKNPNHGIFEFKLFSFDSHRIAVDATKQLVDSYRSRVNTRFVIHLH